MKKVQIKTPTREERNKIYKKVLDHVKRQGWKRTGFCYHLSNSSSYASYEGMKVNFPEIYKRKPKNQSSDHWFPTHGERDVFREHILEQAINETSTKTKRNENNRNSSPRRKTGS